MLGLPQRETSSRLHKSKMSTSTRFKQSVCNSRVSKIPGRSDSDYHKEKKMYLYNNDKSMGILKSDKYRINFDIEKGSSQNLVESMGINNPSTRKQSPSKARSKSGEPNEDLEDPTAVKRNLSDLYI